MDYKTIGTCSICGGAVKVPSIWHGTIPPVPECEKCGAVAKPPGPVIPMEPKRDSWKNRPHWAERTTWVT